MIVNSYPLFSLMAGGKEEVTACQDALSNEAVEVVEDLSRHAKLPQPLLGPLNHLCRVE